MNRSEDPKIDAIVKRFDRAWVEAPVPNVADYLPTDDQWSTDAQHDALIVLVMVDLGYRWQAKDLGALKNPDPTALPQRPLLENYLTIFPQLGPLQQLPLNLICWEYRVRKHWGDQPSHQSFFDRFPSQIDSLKEAFANADLDDLPPTKIFTEPQEEEPNNGSAHDTKPIPQPFPSTIIEEEGSGKSDTVPSYHRNPDQPTHIGRYRIESAIGRGGFGLVYRAYDDKLQRHVAVKVPHAHLVTSPEQVAMYLQEARTIASLEHPHIVPVYDFGGSEQYPCYIITKYVEGKSLGVFLKSQRLTPHESAEMVGAIAQALHYAHTHGVVHRDVKPANILLDSKRNPFVADFGLALRDEELGKGSRYIGTPAYMSPEQARREGHRVDGRSDLFSLGVVFYELLVGRLPFSGETEDELLGNIIKHEPRPPRQINDSIPQELERICLRLLSKRSTDRYTTAKDLADDLILFCRRDLEQSTKIDRTSSTSAAPVSVAAESKTGEPAKVVPKGLRSFGSHDAGFFLQLLPGPRDNEGIPESVLFWKARIEENDSDETFAVGLVYGPSGCGKSSFMKAGLLPRLSDNVTSIYVESTGNETESRLLASLRKRCPVSDNLTLPETISQLRRSRQGATKTLIVLDQFEQWLHANAETQSPELVQAIRQCDGTKVQCIVMVRDDFWLAVSRFFRELEVRLVEGHNSALTDLFELDHAEDVLAKFGRAHGRLPEESKTTEQQRRFLKEAVRGLAIDGKVICVRIALLADMLKGKPWTPPTLKALGGTEGVGESFLEETFAVSTAPPEHRYHQAAARRVLNALMPQAGSDIKGHMRSRAELIKAAEYEQRTDDFSELLRILDSELRLITPTDPRQVSAEDSTPSSASRSSEKYYQLTHDYLVASLRDWLTRKQQATRGGRAELKLESRTKHWIGANRESSVLPGPIDCLRFLMFVPRRRRNSDQREMIKRAAKKHLSLAAAMVLILGSVVGGMYSYMKKSEVQVLSDPESTQTQLVDAADGLGAKVRDGSSMNPQMIDALTKFLRMPASGTPAEQQSFERSQLQTVSTLVDNMEPATWSKLATNILSGKRPEKVKEGILDTFRVSKAQHPVSAQRQWSTALAEVLQTTEEREIRMACLSGLAIVDAAAMDQQVSSTIFDWCMKEILRDDRALNAAIVAALDQIAVDTFVGILDVSVSKPFRTYLQSTSPSRVAEIGRVLEQTVVATKTEKLQLESPDPSFCENLSLVAECCGSGFQSKETYEVARTYMRRWGGTKPEEFDTLWDAQVSAVIHAYAVMRPSYDQPDRDSDEFRFLLNAATEIAWWPDHLIAIRSGALDGLLHSGASQATMMQVCETLATQENNDPEVRKHAIAMMFTQGDSDPSLLPRIAGTLIKVAQAGNAGMEDFTINRLGLVASPDDVDALLHLHIQKEEPKTQAMSDLIPRYPGDLRKMADSLLKYLAVEHVKRMKVKPSGDQLDNIQFVLLIMKKLEVERDQEAFWNTLKEIRNETDNEAVKALCAEIEDDLSDRLIRSLINN